jgi:hypothetical protein
VIVRRPAGEPSRRRRRSSERLQDARRRAESTWRLTDGDDLEDALRAAERLLAQAEERHRHGQNITIAYLSLIIGVAISFLATITFLDSYRVLISAPLILAILVGSVSALYKQRQRMIMDYTLQIATQLASMVDEVLVDVAEREEWSHVRTDATKLRLSVFPVYRPSGRPHARR